MLLKTIIHGICPMNGTIVDFKTGVGASISAAMSLNRNILAFESDTKLFEEILVPLQSTLPLTPDSPGLQEDTTGTADMEDFPIANAPFESLYNLSLPFPMRPLGIQFLFQSPSPTYRLPCYAASMANAFSSVISDSSDGISPPPHFDYRVRQYLDLSAAESDSDIM